MVTAGKMKEAGRSGEGVVVQGGHPEISVTGAFNKLSVCRKEPSKQSAKK